MSLISKRVTTEPVRKKRRIMDHFTDNLKKMINDDTMHDVEFIINDHEEHKSWNAISICCSI